MTETHDAVGRTRRLEDAMDPWRAAALHAALDAPGPAPGPGDPLPHFQHWIYFLEAASASALGRDGHPARGGFIPDLGLPRRMWAGGRLTFSAPLPLGAPASRLSTIEAVTRKDGRTGPLAFVTLRHEIEGAEGLSVVERQDIVYRQDPAPGAPAPQPPKAPADEDAAEEARFDPTLLFRYSALTFNGHRIHYDKPYAMEVEGYGGLVVHGPLIAQLLLSFAEARLGPAGAFTFRAASPLFDHETAELCLRETGAGAALWARGPDGRLIMSGDATLAR